MEYLALKSVHVASVTLSGLLFALRGAWRLARPVARAPLPLRVLPHVVDTVLLLSALALVSFWLRDKLPLGWIGVKVVALCAYIGLGIVALRPGLPLRTRAIALAAAALTFGFIVSVALAKSPAGIFARLAA